MTGSVNWLKKSTVSETSYGTCRSEYFTAFNSTKIKSKKVPLKGLLNGITKEFMCSKPNTAQPDLCQPDAGSPLQFLSNDIFYIIGITSLQTSCNQKIPSLFTRISDHLEWIESTIW